MTTIAFWLLWSLCGPIFGALMIRDIGDEPPAGWGLLHVLALIAACGPVIWAAMLAVVIGGRR